MHSLIHPNIQNFSSTRQVVFCTSTCSINICLKNECVYYTCKNNTDILYKYFIIVSKNSIHFKGFKTPDI